MTKTTLVLEGSFFDEEARKVFLKDVLSEDDCWQLKNKKWILSHKAVQKIAKLAGISKNYEVEESETITPTYKNELEHIVRLTIHCNAASGRSKGCIHDSERDLTITGEANKVNTPVRGRGYLRKMAEKRAYDIAVLTHLELYSTMSSEDESEEFESAETKAAQPNESISNVEIESLKEEINILVGATDKKKLKEAALKIRELRKTKNYNATQMSFLKELHARQVQSVDKSFE